MTELGKDYLKKAQNALIIRTRVILGKVRIYSSKGTIKR